MARKILVKGGTKSFGMLTTVDWGMTVHWDKVWLDANEDVEKRELVVSMSIPKARRYAQWILDQTEEEA